MVGLPPHVKGAPGSLLAFLGEQGFSRAALLRILRAVLLDPRNLQLQQANPLIKLELREARKILPRQLAGGIAILARALGLFH